MHRKPITINRYPRHKTYFYLLTPTKPFHTEWIIFKYDEWVLTQMVRKPANYWSRARHGTEIVRGVSRPSPRPPHLPTYRARREPHEHPLLLSEAGVKVTSRASLSLCSSCVLALLYSVFGTEYELVSDTGDKIFCVARLLMNSSCKVPHRA